jgi:calcineurin-like phosphoesterase family protein
MSVKRFFTSDTHLGHLLLAGKRGFFKPDERPDLKAHDEEIIRRWNAEVSALDIVFLLGDAVMGNRSANLRLFDRMNGVKHLITGNHDDPWSGNKNSWNKYGPYLEVFASVQPFAQVSIGSRIVLLSHFPYKGDGDHSGEDRFTQFRLRDEGAILLHGHTHSAVRRTSPREIHVGMDAWSLTPVSESRILSMMSNRDNSRGHEATATSPRHGPTSASAANRIHSASTRGGSDSGVSGAPGNPR